MDTKKLRQKILDLAIRGKLVPQDPNDEPASVLIEKIRAEKERLIEKKKIKRDKNESYIYRSDKSYYEKFADGTVKCIDEEIPFEIPESWEWARLGSIARTILYGVSESAQTEGNYKLLRITDIQNNTVNWENVPFTTLPEDKAIEYLLRKDDILFARTGATVGKSYLVNEISNDTIYASYLIRVRLFELFESKYIKFYFESGFYWSQITDKSVGVGQPNVNGTSLKSLLIPVPPYEEQIHIGGQALMLTSIIDNIDNNKNLLADSIKNVKSKILDLAIRGKLVPQDPNDEPASVLLERIKAEHPASKKKASKTSDNSHYRNLPFEIPQNWVWSTLGDLCDYGKCHSINASQIPPNGWVLDLEDIEKDTGYLLARVNKDQRATTSSKHIFKQGEVLYSKLRTYLNKVVIADQDGYCTSEIIPLDFGIYVSPKYARYVLMSNMFLEYTAQCGYGVKMPRLGTNDGRRAPFPLPPLKEQERIVDALEFICSNMHTILDEL